MKTQITKLFKQVQRFHRNDSGTETLQAIMVLAIAAVAAVAVFKLGALIVQFFEDCFFGYPG